MGAGAWVGLAMIAGVGIALVYFFWQHRQERARVHAIKMAGKSRIGGNWTLVDQTGAVISAATLHGRYVLLYFGFTFCPDVCPVELKKMATIVRALDSELLLKDSGDYMLQPLFVSLDPWRDSVEQIGAYTAQFHPRLLGATGTPQQCDAMAKMFRVYTSSDRASATVDPSADDYTVDHSIFIYLIDPEGKFVDFYGVNKEPEEVVDSIREHMIARGDVKDTLWRQFRRLLTGE
jgi:protein SCO1/2